MRHTRSVIIHYIRNISDSISISAEMSFRGTIFWSWGATLEAPVLLFAWVFGNWEKSGRWEDMPHNFPLYISTPPCLHGLIARIKVDLFGLQIPLLNMHSYSKNSLPFIFLWAEPPAVSWRPEARAEGQKGYRAHGEAPRNISPSLQTCLGSCVPPCWINWKITPWGTS